MTGSDAPFDPPLALASLSGEADAEWAARGAAWAGAAFLGGVCLDEASRNAAREMVADRDRTEFLPPDPFAFVDRELTRLADVAIRPGVNVRATSAAPVAEAADIAARHDAVLEVNAHCRQAELRSVGCGESLLRDTERLAAYVGAAADAGAEVSVKVRTEVEGVDLVETARRVDEAGASVLHVDAMDSEDRIADLAAATDLFLVANNGVRDRSTVFEYLDGGADAVSVGRPSDDPRVLSRVREALAAWERGERDPDGAGGPDSETDSDRDPGVIGE